MQHIEIYQPSSRGGREARPQLSSSQPGTCGKNFVAPFEGPLQQGSFLVWQNAKDAAPVPFSFLIRPSPSSYDSTNRSKERDYPSRVPPSPGVDPPVDGG